MTGREIALQVIYKINEDQAYANLALNEVLNRQPQLDAQERAFITELVYGSIRYRGHLDWVINRFAKPKIEKMAPWIRNIIRMGLYQIIFLDHIPVSAAVNESVKLAKKYGHQGTVRFVNGVLRNIHRNLKQLEYPDLATNPVEHLEVVYSHPRWMIEDWVQRFGVEGALELCRYNNQPASIVIRANTLRITREQLKVRLVNEGVETQEGLYAPEALKIINNVNIGQLSSFQEGLFTVQDESSILVGHAVHPRAGEVVWDVCAGPGGKTGHLGQLMSNQGQIMAFDIYEHRLKLVADNCTRLGIKIVVTQLQDARELKNRLAEPVDRILVDAPCSGLGVLARRPDARWQKKPEDIARLAEIQKEILQNSASFVKSGGVLVYSTCTITHQENNQVIESFLAENPDFYLDTQLPQYLSETKMGSLGWVQFLPHAHGIDGFFIARMKRY